jgi:hypothetical protein
VTGVRGPAGGTIGSVGSTSGAATPLESKMWDDVAPDVRAFSNTF